MKSSLSHCCHLGQCRKCLVLFLVIAFIVIFTGNKRAFPKLNVQEKFRTITKMLKFAKENRSEEIPPDQGAILINRRQMLLDRCQEKGCMWNNYLSEPNLFGRFILDRKHRLAYCHVPKIGTTFMKRLFLTMTEAIKVDSLFDLSTSQAHRSSAQKLKRSEWNYPALKNFETILVVRDPYERLVSGYIDKFVGPNNLYHRKFGTFIIRKYRANASAYSKRCGHDVTFLEFVRYFVDSIETGIMRDDHFTPVNILCRPCWVKYDAILKLESIIQELEHFVRNVGLGKMVLRRILLGNSTKKKVAEDDIRHAIHLVSRNRDKIAQCLSLYEVLKRIWKRQVSRGFISDRLAFPLTREQANGGVTNLKFQEILETAYKLSEGHDVKMNRDVFFKEAYKSVPDKYVVKLRDIFQWDCKLFGYESACFRDFNLSLTAP